ncbi:IS110 family transposase [Deinococcus multiflagellatus]|uniref:IS110 family transposase n=1 Tax=Deinococcus multiflagellatus TaxID=1656887 RepID=A0ABW1ZMK7_9DEIO|nr:IS110 family transposase [Deinococcus multiflagellatus]MBZ9712600.1 IS110 family transposase [Deinococcus multiflagellatus]
MHVLGLDMAKDTFCAHLLRDDGTGHALSNLPNTPAGFDRVLRWAHKAGAAPQELHVVMEPTGVYWEHCAQHLFQVGCTVSVVNPTRIRYFARSEMLRGKTDSMDARTIALYGVRAQPNAWSPPSPALQELKILVRERTALTQMLSSEQGRLHAAQHRAWGSTVSLRLVQERIAFLKAQIVALETAMNDLVQTDEALGKPLTLLMTIPGYGFLTAASVLAETDAFALMDTGAEIAAYAGIAPAAYQSGTSVQGRGRISKIGNASLRRTAYLAAAGVKHGKGRLGQYYRHLRAQGKPPKVALIALGRKLLRTGLAVVKSGLPYSETYVRPALQ